MLGGVVSGVEVAVHVHCHLRLPVVLGDVGDRAEPDRAGDVGQDVELAPGVDRLIDHLARLLEVRDVAEVGYRLAALGRDLVDDLLGGPRIRALAECGGADVRDDDLGAFSREGERDPAAVAAARAGYHRGQSLESPSQSVLLM